jgi:outer membrane usher protein FimD/PapC
MRYPKAAHSMRIAIIALMLLACAGALMAQNPQNRPGTLRGQVTDPSGGSVANAAVQLTSPAGQVVARTTDANGAFDVTDLAPGNYSLAVTVAGFAPKEQALQVTAGQVQQLTVSRG